MGTMGALMAYSAVGGETVIPAHAMGNIGNVKGQHVMARAQSPVQQFDIPPGPLDSVMNSFQSITGLHVQMANDNMRNLNSPGVKGAFTVDQALKQILSGTGLAHSFT